MIKPRRWTHKGDTSRHIEAITKGAQEYQVLIGRFIKGRRRKYGLRKVLPFLGIEVSRSENRHTGVGVGLLFTESGRIWITGLLGPASVIHSWRSIMFLIQVLEKAKEVDRDILQYCWLLMNDYRYRDPNDLDIGYAIDAIARMLNPKNPHGTESEVERIRNDILQSIPPLEEVEILTKKVWNAGLKIQTQELAQEIVLRKIIPTPFIKKIIELGKKSEDKLACSTSLINFSTL